MDSEELINPKEFNPRIIPSKINLSDIPDQVRYELHGKTGYLERIKRFGSRIYEGSLNFIQSDDFNLSISIRASYSDSGELKGTEVSGNLFIMNR